MIVEVSGQYKNGEFLLAGTKGCAEIECELNDINHLSLEKSSRMVAIGKNTYRLTLKSYKEVKREFAKRGMLYRFDFGKRK